MQPIFMANIHGKADMPAFKNKAIKESRLQPR